MATALDVVTRGLRLAGILAGQETPSAGVAQTALATLNGMMHGLELQGIRLGHSTRVLADTVNLPESHIEALTWMLADRIATEWGLALRQDVLAQSARQEAALRAAYVQVPVSTADPAYGDTLAGWRWNTW